MNPIEEWKPVVGFEGKYEVSDLGRVRSLNRDIYQPRFPGGKPHRQTRKGQILRPGRMPQGHQSVVLTRKGGSFCVHALVLAAFVGPRPSGMDVRHLDGNPANNTLGNLAYGTRSENCADAVRHGRRLHAYDTLKRKWARIDYQGRKWTTGDFFRAFCHHYKRREIITSLVKQGLSAEEIIARDRALGERRAA